jgi:16S rRNA (guanine966-N2)-methyltransferase
MSTAQGSVRIIAGSLRGSKLQVFDCDGLRPTPDRVRETLFNWLASSLIGAPVIDAFAGTGALGIEALSRGAAFVDFVEINPVLAQNLQAELNRLKVADRAAVHCLEAISALPRLCAVRAPKLVFIDPPFAKALHQSALDALAACLAPQAMVYLESPKGQMPKPSSTWLMHRQSHAGAVEYAVWRKQVSHAG